MSVVALGSTVRVAYVGRLASGEVFDSSEGREPLEFVVGSGEVIPGFDQGLLGMARGQVRTVSVAPDDAYGPRHDHLVSRVPRDRLPEGIAVGDQLVASAGDEQIPVTLIALDESEGTVDANHPLAGQTLIFEVTLVGLDDERPGPPSRIILP